MTGQGRAARPLSRAHRGLQPPARRPAVRPLGPGIPRLVGPVGLQRQPGCGRPLSWSNLKSIGVALVVVGDHITEVDPLDPDAGQVVCGSLSLLDDQVALDKRLTQVAGAQAVRRKFLPGQMNQPDVAAQLPGLAEPQQDRSRLHQPAVAEWLSSAPAAATRAPVPP